MKFILLITFLFISFVSRAQSDTLSLDSDTLRVDQRQEDDTTRRDVGYIHPMGIEDTDVTYTASLSGNYAAGTVNRFLVTTAHHVNLKVGKFNAPLMASFGYGKQNDLLRERELMFISTPTYKMDKWRVYLDAEFEKSNVRGIMSRHMRGGGIGYELHSKSNNDISISNLILYEDTRYTNGLNRELFRNSTRLKVKLSYKIMNLSSTTYYQPSIKDFSNYRFNNNTTFSFKLINQLAFTITYQYMFESVSVVTDKKRANTFVTAGFSFSHK